MITAERQRPGGLSGLDGCRIVHFMVHNRVSFGRAVIALGLLYLWLVFYPLKERQNWAWWTFLLTELVSLAGFLAHLGYGYLDAWHGLVTLGTVPFFPLGLAFTWGHLAQSDGIRSLLRLPVHWPWPSVPGLGRACSCPRMWPTWG